MDLDTNKLKSIVNDFSKAKILVLGDLILDEYLVGYPSRISREAPVIILKHIKSKYALGGASNAANNIAALGASVTLVGVLGDDADAKIFANTCKEKNIKLESIKDSQRCTTTKTRVVSTSNSNPDAGTVVQQQMLRIDKEDQEAINGDLENQILEKIKSSDYDLILLSDYSNGVLTESLAQKIIKDNPKTIVVDSNGDFRKFKGATTFTPNQPDLEKLVGHKISDDNSLEKSAFAIMKELEAKSLLVTRGAKGMSLFEGNQITHIPAINISEVFDVTGAGDTVSAVYSLALNIGASSVEAAYLGNLAASIVVRKYGTATVKIEEILEILN